MACFLLMRTAYSGLDSMDDGMKRGHTLRLAYRKWAFVFFFFFFSFFHFSIFLCYQVVDSIHASHARFVQITSLERRGWVEDEDEDEARDGDEVPGQGRQMR